MMVTRPLTECKITTLKHELNKSRVGQILVHNGH